MRVNYATWEETFMGIAEVTAGRSKDPRTQVGACIVAEDKRILSIGYNGTPNGFDDRDFPWSQDGSFLESKYAFVVHAERNAILNFRGSLREFQGSTLYTTHFPCNECAKEIAQVGIKEVVYKNGLRERELSEASTMIFNAVGVKYRPYSRNGSESPSSDKVLFRGKTYKTIQDVVDQEYVSWSTATTESTRVE